MKNIYIVPKTEFTEVKLCNMIAVSAPIYNGDATKDGNGDYNDSRRRHNNEWDDWDDDF